MRFQGYGGRADSLEGAPVISGRANNGMHPTANSAAFIENLPLITSRRGG